MAYLEVAGDLFDLDLPAIGHGCNCEGSMSGGIARDFRRRFPLMYTEYARRCAEGSFVPGGFFRWVLPELVIYNLATQPKSGADAKLWAIEASVRAALEDAAERGLSAVGLPRIGAGIGGLVWADVAAILQGAAADSGVDVIVARRSGTTGERPFR